MPTMGTNALRLVLVALACTTGACAVIQRGRPVPQPTIIPHAVWDSLPPLGHNADAARRNKAAGDSLTFRELTVTIRSTGIDSSSSKPVDVVWLRLAGAGQTHDRVVRESQLSRVS